MDARHGFSRQLRITDYTQSTHRRKNDEWGYKLTNQNLLDIGKTEAISAFIERQKKRYLAHLIRLPNKSVIKRILFNSDTTNVSSRQMTFLQPVLEAQKMNLQQFERLALAKKILIVFRKVALWQQHGLFVKVCMKYMNE